MIDKLLSKCKLEKKELLLVLGISAVVIIYALSVIVYAILKTPAGSTFQVLDLDDEYSYFSFIEQAKNGSLLFKNLYTLLPQQATLFQPLFLLMGICERIFHLTHPAVYTLARVFCDFFFLIGIYVFSSLFFKEKRLRLTVFLMVCLSSGLGWLNIVFPKPVFMNYINFLHPLMKTTAIPEALTFTSLLFHPHFVVSVLFMIGAFGFYLKSTVKENTLKQTLVLAGIGSLLGCISFFSHPFNIVTLLAVPWMFCLVTVSRKCALATAAYSSLILLTGGIQWLVTQNNSSFQSFAENSQLSPSPLHWLILFGGIIPLMVAGIIFLYRHKTHMSEIIFERRLFLLVWILTTAALIYFPFSFQRRLIEGAHIPLAFLAGYGLYEMGQLITSSRIKIAALTAAFVFLSLQNLAYPFDLIRQYIQNYPHSIYLSNQTLTAFVWAENHLPRDARIISTPEAALLIPPYTDLPVLFGHYGNTPHFYSLVNDSLTNFFYSTVEDNTRISFIKDHELEYLVYNKKFSPKDSIFNPYDKPYCRLLYENSDIAIFTFVNH